jgi:putative FmdB family regulatory protein
MPIFDFHCRGCGHEFEALVRPAAAPACPSCGGGDLEKQISSFAVSSAEKTRAAAAVSRRKAATTAGRDRVALEREGDAHRREEH